MREINRKIETIEYVTYDYESLQEFDEHELILKKDGWKYVKSDGYKATYSRKLSFCE